MDVGGDTRAAAAQKNRSYSEYSSPYVEISSDNYDYESTFSATLSDRTSSNTFFADAEIIPSINSLPEADLRAQERMRKKLAYFFMNPIQKWHAKGRFPWKLCLQIVKIVFVTMQLFLFGLHSYKYVQQHQDMTTTLSRIFLKDWSVEVSVYPPSNGPYAVYTIPEFYENIDYVVKQFTEVTTLAIGPYAYDSHNGTLTPLVFCTKFFSGNVFPSNSSLKINTIQNENCFPISPQNHNENFSRDDFSIKEFLESHNFSINFHTMINARLYFSLKTVFLKSLSKLDTPECYRLKIHIDYDNSQHDGQVMVKLVIHSNKVACHIETESDGNDENVSYLLRQILNSIVMLLCIMSTILCLRSLFSGYKLGSETYKFFKKYFEKELATRELFDFIDFWYVMIVISDILLIFGSLIKIQIEERSAEGTEYSKCSMLLGIGNLLIWVGLLRYLGFFPKYNMLILTLKRALPNVLRFILCAVFLYMGFCFCGWIVLAPYHIKFRSLSRTSECLFAVMNGDDMFATFALINTNNNQIWWFSRIYLYSFLVLFVYVVISLFISVIMDTFETIKSIYLHGSPPKTTVDVFLAAKSYTAFPPSSRYELEHNQPISKCDVLKNILTWLKVHWICKHQR